MALERKLALSQPATVTISVGLATMQRDTTIDALIDLADKALYRSKSAGRNRVSVA